MTPAIMEINYDLFFSFSFYHSTWLYRKCIKLKYKTVVHVKSILYLKKMYICGGGKANEKSTSPELEKYIKELNITQ